MGSQEENIENVGSTDSRQSWKSQSTGRITRSALRNMQSSRSRTESEGADDLFLNTPITPGRFLSSDAVSPASISTVRLSPLREAPETEWFSEMLDVNHLPGDDSVAGTIRRRYDKNSIEQNTGSSFPIGGTESPQQDGRLILIWGTDLNIKNCQDRFQQFVMSFNTADEMPEIDENTDPTMQTASYYMRRLHEIHILEYSSIDVDCDHLSQFDNELCRNLVTYPQEVIPAFDLILNEIYNATYPDSPLPHQIEMRPYNSTNRKPMRALDPSDIDQLITINGMVIRISPLIPEMRIAFFQCAICRNTLTVEVERGNVDEPTLCTQCNTTHAFILVHNRSVFTDKQMVKLQESPDDMAAGLTPHTIMVSVHSDLVDTVKSGDRIEVTGIFRASSVRVNPKMRMVRSVHNTLVDAVHFRSPSNNQLREVADLSESETVIKFSPERVDQIIALSQRQDIYELLADAIAPNIYENREVKKGILLQLFGGTKKDLSEYGRGHFRSELNVLLCGDPGTSKSQLLQYVYRLVPRSQYTSGKGTSAVGLTAYVTKDPETGQHVLQTGALVLADNGV